MQQNTTDTESLLTESEISEFLQLSVAWLRRQRWAGSGPPYYKIGHSVRYSLSKVVAWLEETSN